VRHAIEAVLLNPAGVRTLAPPPWGFEELDRPGIDLLARLLQHCLEHGVEHGAELLRAFEADSAYPALVKLFSNGAAAAPEALASTLQESVRRLAEEHRRERRSLLAARADRGELSAEEAAELRQLWRQAG
jgi:DNA primase